MNGRRAVEALSALAHEYRLAVYRLLIQRGPEGLPAGVIGERLALAPSSLTFHLQTLLRARLVRRVRVSRQLFYSADFNSMNDLVGYLTDECCAASSVPVPECEPARSIRKSKSTKAA